MSIPGGKTINGVKWFWKTYQQWSEELQLSVSTIRRAVSNLKKLGLLAVDKLSAKTHYQANWYTVKTEALSAFIQNEEISLLNLNTSICSKSATYIKDFSSKEFSTQQHAAADKDFVEENSETLTKDVTTTEQTIEQTIETRSPSSVEQSTIPRFVEEQNHSCSSTQPLTHEDFSSAASEPIEKPHIVDVREICNQLRQIPCTPNFRLNQEIIAVINKMWRNVPGAIAYLKEALRTWKRVDSPEAVFVAACKNGRKPENWGKPLPNYPQPSDEDLAQLAEAKSTKRSELPRRSRRTGLLYSRGNALD